jgi:hypothetical protein
MCGKVVGRVIALVSAVVLVAMSAPAAWGAPSEGEADPNSVTLPLTDLGFGSALEFYGLENTQQLTLPVPHGLKPTSLNMTVELPINLRSGLMTVTQNERILAKFDLPATDQVPIVIPLNAAEITDNVVTVLLRANLVPKEGFCLYGTSPLRLINGTVSYAGIEQPPTTVAHFLPPVLKKLTIFVSPSPSDAESDGAVHLAASAAARYRGHVPEITVVPLANGQAGPTTPPQAMERQIVVKEGPNRGLSLQGSSEAPWLLISRPSRGADTSDIDVLFSDVSELAVSPKAVAGSVRYGPTLPGDTTTLRDLGQPGLKSVGLQPAVAIGLDQTRFGRSFHSVRVHLLGSYSPTPGNTGGQITVGVGGETIDHWPTDGQGNIDRWVDVPDRLLQRYTSLNLELDVAGNVGPCGDFYTAGAGARLLELTINSDTTVQTSPASPPVPDGLRSVPQALMPVVQVGIEQHSFGDTARAVDMIVGLQRISSIPLDTFVTSVRKAIDSPSPAILIAAEGWNHPDIVLPFSAGNSGPVTVNAILSDGKPTTLELDPTVRFASLQTVFNRGRQLLIATSNGAPLQLDALLKSLSRENTRWPGLGGVALVSVPGQDPVSIDQKGPAATPEKHSGLGWLWWLVGGWLAIAAIGAAAIVIRSRLASRRT